MSHPTDDRSAFFGSTSSAGIKRVYEDIPLEAAGRPYVLGPYNSENLWRDPRRIGFMLARYKWVAKMLDGKASVLEVGCQEGLGTTLVARAVARITAVDFYRPHVEHCQAHVAPGCPNITFQGHDMLDGPVAGGFDAGYTLDVLEHIEPAQEHLFMTHLAASLGPKGVAIVGMPSLEFQPHASPASRAGHINCKTGQGLRELCGRHFDHVFMFAMNDEVVHTGFLPMACYLLALCVGPRR
ncbi:MAG: methyltransferase domain-containing protein [Anaeromyxobacter sp.]